MPTFVSLINWTEKGIANFKDTPKRAAAFEEILTKHGAKLKEILWTIGPYDIVSVVEAPDDETATAALLEVGALGNVRTTTLRAFNRKELEGVIKKVR